MTRHPPLWDGRKLLIVALLIGVTLFAAFHEEYITRISPLFWGGLVLSFGIAAWVAHRTSVKRFMALVVGLYIVEYIKETVGIRSGTWVYHGKSGLYVFGVWAWVFGGLSAYALAVGVLIPALRKVRLRLPRWSHPLIILLLAAFIPLTLGPYWQGVEALFFWLYGVLAAACIFMSMRIESHVMVGIVLASWIIGNPSEYLGAIASDVVSFPHNPRYPPVFLLFGCWPLEILVQYGMSAYLAREPLRADAGEEGETE